MAGPVYLGEHLEQMAQSPETPDTGLIVQGGGMRGVYSLGALAELEEISDGVPYDLRDAFLQGVGSSAGFINLAHYSAGYARHGIRIYSDYLTDGKFMPRAEPKSALAWDVLCAIGRGCKFADMDHLISEKALRKDGTLTELVGRMSIYAALTNAQTGEVATMPATIDEEDPLRIYRIFQATGALPVLYNRKIEIDGVEYVDGGATSSVPLESALSLEPRPKHMLAILTREPGYRNEPRPWIYRHGVPLLAFGQSKPVKQLVGGLNEVNYNRDMDRLESEDGIDPQSGVSFTLVQPSDPNLMVGRTTIDRARIVACADMGRRDMADALEKAAIAA